MISHRHKCIFIHIPKCAGTSIEAALGHLDGHIGRGGQDHRTIRDIEPLSLKTFGFRRAYRSLFPRPVKNPNNLLTVTKEQFRTYYKFAFVRNPWDRAYSWYRNVMWDEERKKILGIEEMPFYDFLVRFGHSRMMKPQVDYLKGSDGKISFDFIGRFENLHRDFAVVCKNLGIVVNLPHRTRGDNRQYQYDQETSELIRNMYREDIEVLGYEYDYQQKGRAALS